MTDELKPVPCGCGGEVRTDHIIMDRSNEEDGILIEAPIYRVHCRQCGITTPFVYLSEAEAITAWNTAMGNRDESSRVERTAKVKKSPSIQMSGEVYIVNAGHCECGSLVFNDVRHKYCPQCGAKLDWGDGPSDIGMGADEGECE